VPRACYTNDRLTRHCPKVPKMTVFSSKRVPKTHLRNQSPDNSIQELSWPVPCDFVGISVTHSSLTQSFIQLGKARWPNHAQIILWGRLRESSLGEEPSAGPHNAARIRRRRSEYGRTHFLLRRCEVYTLGENPCLVDRERGLPRHPFVFRSRSPICRSSLKKSACWKSRSNCVRSAAHEPPAGRYLSRP